MKILVQGRLPDELGLTRSRLKAAAAFFAERSARRVRAVFREVAIVVQNDETSDAVHRAIVGVAGATDVITQSYDAMPPEPNGTYGELYVNADQALRFAARHRRRGWSAASEFLLYVAHGMDHLSGADDYSDAGYRAMRRRELRWLKELPADAGLPQTARRRAEATKERH